MDCGEGSGTCSAWQNNHRCFTELHGAFQSDADAGLTSCGGGTQVIPTPSHLLGHILPIFSPFFPFFCAFSPSRRGGSNEPKPGIQGHETASRAPKHRFAGLANSGCSERMSSEKTQSANKKLSC